MNRARIFFPVFLFLPFNPGFGEEGKIGQSGLSADLIVRQAHIWTVNKKQPEAQALAIVGDRLVFVGTDAEVQKWIGPKTRVLDLKGQRVVPGFHDSHVHLLGSGLRLSQVALKDAKRNSNSVGLQTPRAGSPNRMSRFTHTFQEWHKNKPPAGMCRKIPLEDVLAAVGHAKSAPEIVEGAKHLVRIEHDLGGHGG